MLQKENGVVRIFNSFKIEEGQQSVKRYSLGLNYRDTDLGRQGMFNLMPGENITIREILINLNEDCRISTNNKIAKTIIDEVDAKMSVNDLRLNFIIKEMRHIRPRADSQEVLTNMKQETKSCIHRWQFVLLASFSLVAKDKNVMDNLDIPHVLTKEGPVLHSDQGYLPGNMADKRNLGCPDYKVELL